VKGSMLQSYRYWVHECLPVEQQKDTTLPSALMATCRLIFSPRKLIEMEMADPARWEMIFLPCRKNKLLFENDEGKGGTVVL
jgi:hypothetical protein